MAAEKSEKMQGEPNATDKSLKEVEKELEEIGASGESAGASGVTKETVIAPEALIKHPLQNKWTLWFFKNYPNKSWEENLREVTSFDTVEDFWALYNHIEVVSKLSVGCDYSLFKQGIRPMWEDKRNKRGGRWLINMNKNKNIKHDAIDNYWMEVLLCLIGEAFDDQSDEICGAVINIRARMDKIAVWTGDARAKEGNARIGEKLKERLNIPPASQITYEAHEDTQSKTGSTAKVLITI